MEQKAYQCEDCGKEEIKEFGAAAPECDDCGTPMKEIPLDECTQAFNSESARPDDVEDACDDGVH